MAKQAIAAEWKSESYRKWYLANAESAKAKWREWWAGLSEEARAKHLARQRENYRRNRASRIEGCRDYQRRNPERVMLIQARASAKRKGLEFNLDIGDIVIPSTCPVFGFPLVWSWENGRSNRRRHDGPTLDRIDNSMGYVKDNVWVISWRANRIKNDASFDELRLLAVALRARVGL